MSQQEIFGRVTKPGQAAPSLMLPLVAGGQWHLGDQKPQHFTLIAFYRGLHCPHCRTYLRQLEDKSAEFRAAGIEPVAVSGDDEVRATEAKQSWELKTLPVAYGQKPESMREWGLFLTNAILPTHPPIFGEPGLFAVDRSGIVYFASVISIPFGRPSLSEIYEGLSMMIEKRYPPRGAA